MIKKILVMMFLAVFVSGIGFSQEAKKEEIKLDAKACLQKCMEFIKANDGENAIKYAEHLVKLDGKTSNHHFQLGLAYNIKLQHKDTGMMEKMNYATNMLNAWKKAVELDGSNLKARRGLVGFYLNAPPIAGGSTEKAEEQVKEIIKIDKLFGYTTYAGIYTKNKEFVIAKEYAVKALKLHLELIKKDPKKKSSFNVNILNNLGYGILGSEKKEDAIDVFKMNIKAFPKNFNTYDSLAEAYMNGGKTKPAIEYYEKALKLNPNKTKFEKNAFENQKKYLEKLKSKK